jgi:hypothetical protein
MRLPALASTTALAAATALLFGACSVPDRPTVIIVQPKPSEPAVVGYWVVDLEATAAAAGKLTPGQEQNVAIPLIDGVAVTAKTNLTDPLKTPQTRATVLNTLRQPTVHRSLVFNADGTGEDWFIDPKYFRQLKRSFNWRLGAPLLRLEYQDPKVAIDVHLEQTNRLRFPAPRGPIIFRREK